MSIFQVKEIEKAYTEGVYSDTPANRKLGRVGMRYTTDSSKQSGEKKETIIEREIKPKLEDFEESTINDNNNNEDEISYIEEYKKLQENLTDKDIVENLYVSNWSFDIYKVKNKFYGSFDNRKYIFFASGYHSNEGFTVKRLHIRNLNSINNIETQIKKYF